MMKEWAIHTSFNGELMARILRKAGFAVRVEPLARLQGGGGGIGLVWATAEAASPSFKRALEFEEVEVGLIDEEIRRFAEYVKGGSADYEHLVVVSLIKGRRDRGYGVCDLSRVDGSQRLLWRMNQVLSEGLEGEGRVTMINGDAWIWRAGEEAIQAKQDYVAKIPFGVQVFELAVEELRILEGVLAGKGRKLIVTDLDDTLWGGILGDEGWPNLRLGGHDHLGECYRDIQAALKRWVRSGVQLAILSKNEESLALEAIRRHPGMILREEDFAGWRINWKDKAENMQSLLDELKLRPESVVFLDDNLVERERMRQVWPEVEVLDLPPNRFRWPEVVRNLSFFDRLKITAEDRLRVDYYREERARRGEKERFHGGDEWLASLGMRVRVARLGIQDKPRALQLMNKTNQMNLTVRRMNEGELDRWLERGGRDLLVVHVEDKFGDSGLVGLLGMEHRGARVELVDYVLSCRVMGRGVEKVMLGVVVKWARVREADKAVARLCRSGNNSPCEVFFREESGWKEESLGEFSWSVGEEFPSVAWVDVVMEDD